MQQNTIHVLSGAFSFFFGDVLHPLQVSDPWRMTGLLGMFVILYFKLFPFSQFRNVMTFATVFLPKRIWVIIVTQPWKEIKRREAGKWRWFFLCSCLCLETPVSALVCSEAPVSAWAVLGVGRALWNTGTPSLWRFLSAGAGRSVCRPLFPSLPSGVTWTGRRWEHSGLNTFACQ